MEWLYHHIEKSQQDVLYIYFMMCLWSDKCKQKAQVLKGRYRRILSSCVFAIIVLYYLFFEHFQRCQVYSAEQWSENNYKQEKKKHINHLYWAVQCTNVKCWYVHRCKAKCTQLNAWYAKKEFKLDYPQCCDIFFSLSKWCSALCVVFGLSSKIIRYK